MILLEFGSGFKDELIATAFVLAVTVAGSYFFLDQVLTQSPPTDNSNTMVLGLSETTQDSALTSTTPVGLSSESDVHNSPSQANPTPTPTVTPSPTPTIVPTIVEVPNGSNQDFENNSYRLQFKNPRVIIGQSRKFLVEVVLANKSVPDEGLSNSLLATITRDGQIVANDVPMTLSEPKRVHIGEQITYTASLSMIESTDITTVMFKPPGGIVPVTYNLNTL